MKELLTYQKIKYLKSNKIIIPLLLWIVFLRMNYSQMNLSYVQNIIMSMGTLFFIMTWIGYGYQDIEDPVSEQLLILKVHSFHRYNISKTLFLMIISSALSFIGIIYPMISNVMNGFRLFDRSVNLEDILFGFILHFIVAEIGALTGSLFQPRIMKDRRFSVLLVFTVALIGYTKGVIIEDFPITRFFLWLFPPVYNILRNFNKIEYFHIQNTVLPIFYGSVYCFLLLIVQIYLLKRNKF